MSSSLCGSDCLINVDVHVDQQEAHQQGLEQGQPEQEPVLQMEPLPVAVRSAQALPPPPSLPRRPRPFAVRNVSYKRPRHANAQLRREGVEDDEEERKLGATVRRHADWWW